MSYNWVSPDGCEGSQLVAKANANAALKNLDDGSEEYNLITDLRNNLSLCMKQKTDLTQENKHLRNEIKLLSGDVEGGRRKTKSKRRKSKHRKSKHRKRRRRRTRRRQRGRG